jgi:hypothetical protein
MVALASPATGPVTLALGLAYAMVTHGVLFRTATDIEERMFAAWAVESLLELDYQLRGAVRHVEYADWVTKLQDDERTLQQRVREGERQVFIKGGGGYPAELAAAESALAIDRATLKAIQTTIPRAVDHRKDLQTRAQEMLTGFDTMRRRLITGTEVVKAEAPAQDPAGNERKDPAMLGPQLVAVSRFNAQMWSDTSKFMRLLVDYMTTAAKYEQEMFEPVVVSVPITTGGQETVIPSKPTAMQHYRMVISNDSTSMLFLVKVHSTADRKDREGNVVERDAPIVATTGRRGWIPLYPKGAPVKISESLRLNDPARQDVAAAELVLPNQIWLPVKKGDRLEVRAVTYGPMRQHIRWLSLRGRNIVPDIDSIRRSYYYLGWQLSLVGQVRDAGSRRYSVHESYSWRFPSENWGKNPTEVDTPPADLYEAPEWVKDPSVQPLFMKQKKETLTGIKHITWTVPAADEEFARLLASDKPFRIGRASGTAKFMHVVTIASPRVVRGQTTESSEGTFSLKIEPW